MSADPDNRQMLVALLDSFSGRTAREYDVDDQWRGQLRLLAELRRTVLFAERLEKARQWMAIARGQDPSKQATLPMPANERGR